MKRIPSTAHPRRLLASILSLDISLTLAFTSLTAATHGTYYVNDHLATTVAAIDAAGEVAALEADAFGASIGNATTPHRYTGKPYDEDVGAYVFPFRNLRPTEAQWMSADPSGFPDGSNASAYAPVPTIGIDPTAV